MRLWMVVWRLLEVGVVRRGGEDDGGRLVGEEVWNLIWWMVVESGDVLGRGRRYNR